MATKNIRKCSTSCIIFYLSDSIAKWSFISVYQCSNFFHLSHLNYLYNYIVCTTPPTSSLPPLSSLLRGTKVEGGHTAAHRQLCCCSLHMVTSAEGNCAMVPTSISLTKFIPHLNQFLQTLKDHFHHLFKNKTFPNNKYLLCPWQLVYMICEHFCIIFSTAGHCCKGKKQVEEKSQWQRGHLKVTKAQSLQKGLIFFLLSIQSMFTFVDILMTNIFLCYKNDFI